MHRQISNIQHEQTHDKSTVLRGGLARALNQIADVSVMCGTC